MIDRVKKRIIEFIIMKKFLHSNYPELNFTDFFSTTGSILIIMPFAEKDFNLSLELLRFLAGENKILSLLIIEHRVSLIPRRNIQEIISFQINDITKLQLPSRRLTEILKEKSYDMVMDLNRQLSYFSGAAANIAESKYRIGFKKDGADKFYNIQYAEAASEPDLEYKNFAGFLSMF